ncbi:hypothetical protein [Protofrankia symbiont of Coriaria ruscifolia]|uniref:Uncharacterized protein n=1 Tax=Candidatus Protofrankia californiensis TaxID=1839754 RepID=A0A1C3NYC8_9ACTN|nr:hypothetical protein [Protofrankia symbiont of Coriaria ruscifolia]SBW22554.1 hypothetical protein FDG2_2806 [Candidatus Protofrankia californiensis]
MSLIGHLPLPLGAASHEGSTVIVALNGFRLLHSPRREGPRSKNTSSVSTDTVPLVA